MYVSSYSICLPPNPQQCFEKIEKHLRVYGDITSAVNVYNSASSEGIWQMVQLSCSVNTYFHNLEKSDNWRQRAKQLINEYGGSVI